MKFPNKILISTLSVGAVIVAGCNTDPTPNPKILEQMNSQRNAQRAHQTHGAQAAIKPGSNPYGNSAPTSAPTKP